MENHANSAANMPADVPASCGRCRGTLTPQTSVRFWDGRDYCADCLDAVLPGLAGYARTHRSLSETAPYPRHRILRGHLKLFVACFSVFGVFFGCFGYIIAGIGWALFGIATAMCFTLVVAAMEVPCWLWAIQRALPTVTVENGIVQIRRGARRKLQGEFPLVCLRWRNGWASLDSSLIRGMFPNLPVIILEVPLKWLRVRAACGWSDETKERWKALLTLANVPRK